MGSDATDLSKSSVRGLKTLGFTGKLGLGVASACEGVSLDGAARFPLAEAATYLKGARHVCLEALWRKDHDLEHSAEAAMAKFWAPKLAVDVIHQCLLTIGHIGYSSEHKVGQRLRDVIGLEIGDGTAQVSKLVISRSLLGRQYAP